MSVQLDFNIRASGAPELGQVSNAVTQINEKLKLSSGELKIFDAALMSSVKSGLSLKQALQDIAQPSTTLSSGINNLAKELLGADASFKAASAGAQQFGRALTTGVVSPLTATSGAIRVIEGQQSIRVVENLLGKTLGLGPAFQAAFPIFGAIAMTEMLGHIVAKVGDLYNSWNPVLQAQEKSLALLKQMSGEFTKLSNEENQLRYDQVERTRGPAARYRLEATDNQAQAAYGDQRLIETLRAQIAKAESAVATGTMHFPDGTIRSQDSSAVAASEQLVGLNGALENAQKQQNVDLLRASVLNARATQEDRRAADELARKAAEARQRSASEQQSFVNRMQNKELNPVEAIYAQRDDLKYQTPGQMASNNDVANQAATRELEKMGAQAQYRFDPKYEGQKRGGESAMEAMALIQGMHSGTTSKDIEEGLKKFDESVIKRIKTVSEMIDRDAVQGAEASTRRIRSQTGLATLQAGRGLSGEALINARGAVQLSGNDQTLDAWKQAAAQVTSEKQREELLSQKILEHETKREEIQTRMVEELEQARQRQTEQFASTFTGGIMSMITGHGQGGVNFIRQMGTQATSHIVDNVAKNFIFQQGGPVMNTLGAAGNTFNGGTLGKIFGGILPMGGGGTTDPLAKPADKLNTAGDKLIVAAQTMVAGGSTAGVAAGSFGSTPGFGGMSAIPGLGGLTSTLAMIPGLTTFGSDVNGITGAAGGTAKAATAGGFGGFLKSASTGLGSLVGLMGNPFGDKGGSPGINGAAGTDDGHISGMGIAAAGVDIAVGAMTAIQQFKRGGAKGALGGTSAILGTAASLDPEPISKTILGATAAITGMVTTLLGDPKVQRANAIASNLFKDQYLAPQAINASSSTGGGFSDTDRFGNVRASTLSPYSQSSQSYLDVPYRFNVPGGQTSQFGGGAAPVIINIHALDTQSFETAMKSNSVAVAESVAHGLTFAQTKLPTALRATLGMG